MLGELQCTVVNDLLTEVRNVDPFMITHRSSSMPPSLSETGAGPGMHRLRKIYLEVPGPNCRRPGPRPRPHP